MKAIQIRRFGGPEVLELVDLPVPSPGPGEVLIRVGACGVNFAETLMREDSYVASYQLPAVPGSEVAGTIEALGAGVDGLVVGQRVGGVLAAARQLTGGYAQFVTAPAAVVVPIPDVLDFSHATGLLVQGLTALYLTRAVSPAGRTVLITAAGGGVGSLLIQLARHLGATRIVAAASSKAKREAAVRSGADAAIGYQDIAGTAPDLVYESVGGEVLPRCLEALAPNGTIVTYGSLSLRSFAINVPELKRMVFGNQTLRGFALGPLVNLARLRADLDELFAMAAAGTLAVTPLVLLLEEAAHAHHLLAGRSTTGKVVLLPN